MATSVHVPRVNNNDDEVKLVEVGVKPGDRVSLGQVLAQVETDKAVLEVESPVAGYVLAVQAEVETVVAVGSVLIWVGDTADEKPPVDASRTEAVSDAGAARAPTAKALALLREHGLSAGDVAASGERLSVADVERFLSRRAATPATSTAPAIAELQPTVPGTLKPLSSSERGMLATVTWHRDVAVPGYIEIEYDTAPWESYAKSFAEEHKLLFSPLLSLMAYRLVALARENPSLNATIVGGKRHEYGVLNIGFTVQAGDVLYLAVARGVDAMSELEYCQAMVDLQKRATLHALGPDETGGATIGFSSMARWKVSRHVPVLPPLSSFMVAHTASTADRAVLGATYDHRLLNGFHVVSALRRLSKP